MTIVWKREWPSLAMLATMFASAAVTWPGAPDRMPVHWSWSGQPDRFGGRVEGVLGLPMVALAVYLLLLWLPRIDPRSANYDAFASTYAVIRTAVVGLLLAVDVSVLLWIRGAVAHLDRGVALAAGAALAVVGNYLPKVKSNWFVGIRTPWTLSSEESWRRTHRLAGWLLTAGGVATVGAAVIRPDRGWAIALGALVTAALVSVVYSYFAWRNDPARVTESAGRV